MLSPLPEIPFTHCLSHPPSTFIRLTAQNPLRSAYFTSPFPKTFLDVLPSIKISLSTPLLLPGKSHGQRSLVGYSPWGCKESDTTERLHFLSITSTELLLIFSYYIRILFMYFLSNRLYNWRQKPYHFLKIPYCSYLCKENIRLTYIYACIWYT